MDKIIEYLMKIFGVLMLLLGAWASTNEHVRNFMAFCVKIYRWLNGERGLILGYQPFWIIWLVPILIGLIIAIVEIHKIRKALERTKQ